MTRIEVKRTVDSITKQIIEKYHPDKVILFGSASRDDGDVHDIDLFIIKSDVPFYGSERAGQLYRMVETDVPVDYIVYKPEEAEGRLGLGDPFIRNIFEEGKVLYG
jgi:predicted nucleotidyltransferase